MNRLDKLQKGIDCFLAIFLLVTIFAFGYKTISESWEPLYNSARYLSRLKTYMPEDYDALDLLTARIRSVEDELNEVLWHKTELGYLNSTFQYSLGKNMINTGSSEMITLPSGALYDLPAYVDTTHQTDEVLAFFDTLEVPHLFVFEHPTTYGDNQPQGDYALLDKGAQMSDEIVSHLRQGGAAVLDSRDILAGEDLSRIVMRTDQHWTYYAALRVARAVAAEIGLDASLLETDQFEVRLYPQKFMGKYGQKIGPGNIDPDDIEIFWPKYETAITRTTVYDKNDAPYEISGEFKDSMIKWEYLYGDSWNIEAYKCYGLTEALEHFHNENAPEKRILIFKDSYGAPVGHFLSLVASDVYLVDLRKSDYLANYYVDLYQPDLVIVSYSRQMLCANLYDMMEGY